MQQMLVLVLCLMAGAICGAAFAAAYFSRRRRRDAGARQNDREPAETVLHVLSDGVITTDTQGRIIYMNPAAQHHTGWKLDAARGKGLDAVYRVVDEHSGLPLHHTFERDSVRPQGTTVKLSGSDGTQCAIRDSFSPLRDSSGALSGWVMAFHDVSQIHEMAEQLTWQASHDPLTGLVNRREFERRLKELIESARDGRKQHALMYMDLDNFKIINDSCGHAAGDEMLRQLASLMQSRMRGSDMLARIGGDEFGVLLESCPLDQGLRIANGMREAIRNFRFVWQDKTFGIGVSIGLVAIDADSRDASNLLVLADAICYEAKSKGKDRVHVYGPQDKRKNPQAVGLNVVSQINHAFEFNNFRLFRQKIVALAPGRDDDVHYETLVRMIDIDGKLIPPSGFMAIAERYNLLTSIERWVISSLLEFLHGQYAAGAISREQVAMGRAFYAVNLSGASINDASFPEFLRQLLTRFNLPAGLLCFEVTETTAISNLTKAAQLMRELKSLGCQFALDDFGIGMSSFAYLKALPVDYIKIDGMFVRGMATDAMDQGIVEAINNIAHILGLKTVAEFVEDETILERLRALGVDYAQGYVIAEPEALERHTDAQPAALVAS